MVIVIRPDINLYSVLLCDSFSLDHYTHYDDNDVISLLFFTHKNSTHYRLLLSTEYFGRVLLPATALSSQKYVICALKQWKKHDCAIAKLPFLSGLCGPTFCQVNETDSCLPAILLPTCACSCTTVALSSEYSRDIFSPTLEDLMQKVHHSSR